jgi:hypothetical protein
LNVSGRSRLPMQPKPPLPFMHSGLKVAICPTAPRRLPMIVYTWWCQM